MTRKIALLLAACALAAPALAADLKKGDTVYLAAKLEGSQAIMLIVPGLGGGKGPDIPPVEPCSPVTVKKVIGDGDALLVKDDTGNDRRISGAWSGTVHGTAAECRAAIEKDGPARVKSGTGYRYEIVAPDHP